MSAFLSIRLRELQFLELGLCGRCERGAELGEEGRYPGIVSDETAILLKGRNKRANVRVGEKEKHSDEERTLYGPGAGLRECHGRQC